MNEENVERFRQRARRERARAESATHPVHRSASLALAEQYEAIADSYARLAALGGACN